MTQPINTRQEAELAKLQAETAKILLDLKEAELQQELRRVEIRQKTADAVKAEQEAVIAGFHRLEAERAEEAHGYSDDANYTFHFNDGVDGDIVYELVETINSWHRQDPEADWTIYIDSPGGYTNEGFVLIDQLSTYTLRTGGTHHVSMVVRGMAASMAGIILQAADDRVMGPNAMMLIHEGGAGAYGSMGEIADRIEYFDLLTERVIEMYASRSKLTRKQIKKKWARKDWWLNAREALELKLVDRIG